MRFVLFFGEAGSGEDWSGLPQARKDEWFETYNRWVAAVRERGTIIAHEGLAPATEAITVRDKAVTEGPYAESVEQISGLVLVDLPDLETALELAKAAPTDLVEVRATVDG